MESNKKIEPQKVFQILTDLLAIQHGAQIQLTLENQETGETIETKSRNIRR